MKESNLSREILLAASREGHRLFVNARGKGFVGGKVIRNPNGSVTLWGAAQITFGLGPDGASDLCGWTKDGKFAALEVKKPKRGARISEGQPEFIAAVLRAGGRAGIVRTVDEALAVLDPSQ